MSESTLFPDTLLPIALVRYMQQQETIGLRLDLAINGIPFLLKMSQEDPLLRQMVEDRKDQFDNSGQPGEQSFGYWWLRSGHSFNGGAGQEFLDSGAAPDQLTRVRFYESTGAYPFDVGKLTAAPAYDYGSAQGGKVYSQAVTLTRDGTQQLAVMRTDSPSVDVWDVSPLALDDTLTSGIGTPQAIATDGNRIFVAIDDSIIRTDDDGSDTVIATLTFSEPVVLGFAKQRLILGHGADLYEVDPNGSSVALSSPLASHANPDWQWNVISDGPTGIFAAGYSGPVSSVFSIEVREGTGGTVELAPPIEQATMPTGERILSMLFYINSLFLLGTSNGIRVGAFTPYAQMQWGPASLEGVPIIGLTAVGSIVHAISTNAVWWLDLGTIADEAGRYAWAKRADTPEPAVAVVAAGDTPRPFVVTNNRIGVEDPSEASTGTLTTSWATWGTVEPKRAFYVAVSGSWPVPGTVTVETLEGDVQSHTIPAGSATWREIGLNLPASAAYRLTLGVARDGGVSNQVRAWQLKALPQPRRYQQLVFPLLLADIEQSADGQIIGYPGFAADRLKAVETMSRTNAVVTIHDYLMGESYQAMIRDVQFAQQSGPEVVRKLGGMVTLIATLVA